MKIVRGRNILTYIIYYSISTQIGARFLFVGQFGVWQQTGATYFISAIKPDGGKRLLACGPIAAANLNNLVITFPSRHRRVQRGRVASSPSEIVEICVPVQERRLMGRRPGPPRAAAAPLFQQRPSD